MDTTKYRAFLETVSLGSLTRAAERLGYSQPGISHMIHSLEREYGFALLRRDREGVQPTENARLLLPYLRQIVQAERGIEQTAQRISGVETGSVRIGAFYSVSVRWLPEMIRDFSDKYPGIAIQLSEGNWGEVREWLVQGEIDLGFLSAPAPEGFDFFALEEDPVMAVLPNGHPLCRLEEVPAEALLAEPFLIPREGSDEEVWRVLEAEGLGEPNIQYRIKGDETILYMVAAGLGVTMMPRLLAENTRADIQIRPLKRKHCRTLGVAVRKEKYLAPAVQRFLEEAMRQKCG